MMAITMNFGEYEKRILKAFDEIDGVIDDLIYLEDYEEIDKVLWEKSKLEVNYINMALKFKDYRVFESSFNSILGYSAFRKKYLGDGSK